ncbi:hypothetical protein B0I33_11235 [Prauserella shujinwangii]|uniref:Uncharacterized protein n=1 Tax=Prauserella shujinwangii TaxID=1453103 RepID=A0A2T0LM47_9PSEU|nr:hypothetical protein [Prauserella shujinwangii]PRX44158.1 hypothetical protein B0I33_11235 [Prauserella shujinwangii]
MRIRTDDEVYRVDAVWLGPPKATFPWRARYVAWGVGIPVFLVVLGVERQMGIGFGFFSTAWAFVATIAITRLITAKISHERPLGAVFTMWMRELYAPRERKSGTGGAVTASKIRVRAERPRPKNRRGPAARAREPDRQQPMGVVSPPGTGRKTARARRRRSPAPVGR